MASGLTYDSAQGGWINEDVQRTAEVLHDWDPTLELQWIPERARTNAPDEMPYRLIHHIEGKPSYTILHMTEDEVKNTEALLGALFAMRDNAKNPEEVIQRLEQARAIREAKEEEERRAPMWDMVHSLATTPLHTYRHNGKKINL